MRLAIITTAGTPVELDLVKELGERAARKLPMLSTRNQVAEAIRIALLELQTEVLAETTKLSSIHS